MSDFAFIAERARRAFASVARLERELERSPDDFAAQLNLAAKQKLANQAQEQLLQRAEENFVEVCNYRLIPETAKRYALPHIAQSLYHYQYLFSQIYDAIKNGAKGKAVIGGEALEESLMDFAYSYGGSLGVVLLVPSDRGFFHGQLDASIDALFQTMEIRDQHDVRDVAKALGNSVVKRIHDWSKATTDAGFAADVQWKRSDGQHRGQVIEQRRMNSIVEIIEATSDENTNPLQADGILVGIDVLAGTFHFVVPDGADYRGALSAEFSRGGIIEVGRRYRADIIETQTTVYATEQTTYRRALKHLTPLPSPPSRGTPAGPAP